MTHVRALIVGPAAVAETPRVARELSATVDLVIAADAGADVCRSAGVDCDVVVGDFDSISPTELARLERSRVRLVRYPSNKDETDLDLALAEALRSGCTQVVVTGVLSGRVDHTLAAVGSLVSFGGLELSVAEPDLTGWVVHAGESIDLEGAGATISVLAAADKTRLSVQGTRWPLTDNVLSALSSRGISNVITAPSARVSVRSGVAFVLSPELLGTKPAACVRRNRVQE